MQSRMTLWQKNMVTKRMMMIITIMNSLLLMFLVSERERSAQSSQLGYGNGAEVLSMSTYRLPR